MNNTINNTKIIFHAVYGLFLLAILAFGIALIPGEAKAARGQAYGGNIYYRTSERYTESNPNSYYQEEVVYEDPAPTPTVYSSTANTSSVQYASAPKPKKAVAKAKAAPAPADEIPEEVSEKYTDLAANAVMGSNSLMPSGLIQWIVFAILILGTVILVRKIYGGAEKYHAMPLKHQ